MLMTPSILAGEGEDIAVFANPHDAIAGQLVA